MPSSSHSTFKNNISNTIWYIAYIHYHTRKQLSFFCFLSLANRLPELRLPQSQGRALINFRIPSADITSCESASKHSGAIVEHIIKRRLAYVINKKERGET